jgi:hypothetical protein
MDGRAAFPPNNIQWFSYLSGSLPKGFRIFQKVSGFRIFEFRKVFVFIFRVLIQKVFVSLDPKGFRIFGFQKVFASFIFRIQITI